MANWQMKLDFSQSKRDYQNKEITLKSLAEITAKEIKSKIEIAKKINNDLGIDLEYDILPMFEEIAEGDEEFYDVNDYDGALFELCEWANTKLDNDWNGKKMCWVVPA